MNILMPQLGETVAEGKITKWFKSAGDAVQPGDSGDLVRRYEFIGDRLVLRPPNSTMEVSWERIK